MAKAAFDARKGELDRKRKTVEELVRAAMGDHSPVINAGGVVVPNWGGAISKIANHYHAEKLGKELKDEETAYGNEYQAALEAAAGRYNAKRDGTPAGFSEAVDRDDNPLPHAATPGDPRKAAVEALVSAFPEMRALAASDLQGLNKRENPKVGQPTRVKIGGKEVFARFDDVGGPPQVVEGIDPPDEYTSVNGQMVPKNQGGDYRGMFGPVTPGPHGGPMQIEHGTGKASFGPAPPSQINNNLPGPTRTRALAAADAKRVEDGYNKSQELVGLIQNTTDALNKVNQIPNEWFGPGASFRVEMAKLPEIFGLPALKGATDMQELHAMLGQQLLAKARALAPVTKVDIDTLEKILGSTSNTKEALTGMLEHIIEISARPINQHNELVNRLRSLEPDQPMDHWLVDFTTAKPSQMQQQPAPGAAPGAAPRPKRPLSEY